METRNKSRLKRIVQGLVVAGGLAGLAATSGGCAAFKDHIYGEVIKNFTFPRVFGERGYTVPKEIKNEEKLNPNRKLLAYRNSEEEYLSFYGDGKGLQLSYYSKNPIWYARVRDKNSDGEIDSIHIQDKNGRETFITPEEEENLRKWFHRLSEEVGGVSRPKN